MADSIFWAMAGELYHVIRTHRQSPYATVPSVISRKKGPVSGLLGKCGHANIFDP
jgi:hypothetical protein